MPLQGALISISFRSFSNDITLGLTYFVVVKQASPLFRSQVDLIENFDISLSIHFKPAPHMNHSDATFFSRHWRAIWKVSPMVPKQALSRHEAAKRTSLDT